MTMLPSDDQLLKDLNFDVDAELEGFFSGKSAGMVNLQPMPEPPNEGGQGDAAGKEGAAAAGVAGATAAVTAAVANLVQTMLGKSSLPPDLVAGVVEKAVPGMLQPSATRVGGLLKKAQPWKNFLIPLSVPTASDGCSRITANIYTFQTNYAILFMLQLALSIIFEPSALICIIITVVVWIFFLKKNDDPEWLPSINGVQLGSTQRLLLMVASTAVVLLFMVGGFICNTCFCYLMLAFVHSVLHDASARSSLPGNKDDGAGAVPL